MKTLELHYPMIQFLIIRVIILREHICYYKDNLYQVLIKRLTNLPSVTIMSIVLTTNSCNKAIVGTPVMHQFVEVVHVITVPMAVTMVIINGTISTLKIVNTIFLAISVDASPKPD